MSENLQFEKKVLLAIVKTERQEGNCLEMCINTHIVSEGKKLAFHYLWMQHFCLYFNAAFTLFLAYTNKFTMTLHFSYLTFFLLLSKYKWRHSILMKYFYYLNKIYAGNFMNKQYVLCAFKSSKIKQNHL